MTLAYHSFEEFGALRDRLAAVLVGVAQVFEDLDEPERAAAQADAKRRLLENRFTVVALGEMKLGKSTLINALLGEKLVPSEFGIACTAVPITVRWGERKRALCYPRGGGPPEEIDVVTDLLRFWKAVSIPPRSARVGDVADDVARELHKYTHAVLEAPLQLLGQGVELQDVPGTGEDAQRTEAAWSGVDQSGAVIVLFSCSQVGKESDRQALREVGLKGLDPRVVFVVWNYYDMCRRDENASARVRVEAHAMAERLGVPPDHICFVSASEGLDAKLRDDPELLEASGVPGLERALGGFLMNELASAKLVSPLGNAERAVAEALQDVLSIRVARWSEPPRRSAEAAREAAEILESSERAKAELSRKMRRTSIRLNREVRAAATDLVDSLCEGVGEVVQRVGISSMDAVFNKDDCKRRMHRAVEAWVAERTKAWEKERLAAVIHEYSSELRDDAATGVSELTRLLRRARDLHEQAKEAHERALAGRAPGDGAETRVRPDAASVADGSALTDDLMSNMSFSTGVGAAAVLGSVLGGWMAIVLAAPLLPFAALIALGWAILRGMSAAEVLKARTAGTVISEMRGRADALERMVADRVRESTRAAIGTVEERVDSLHDAIGQVREQIAREHAANERVTAERLALATRLRTRLQSFADELDALRLEIDPTHNADILAERVAERVRRRVSNADTGPQPQGSPTTTNRPALGVAEMELKLDPKVVEKLVDIAQYLTSYGRWTASSRERILAAWCRLPPKGEQAQSQVPAFLTAAAMAVACGQDGLPLPDDVREWWDDEAHRPVLLDLFAAITGSRHEYESQVSTDGKRRVRGLFLLAYKRAYESILATDEEAAKATPGS